MKQRRVLRAGHMIALLVLLVLIPVSLFFPVLHMDKEVVLDAVDELDLADQYEYLLLEQLSDSLKEVPDVSCSAFEFLMDGYSGDKLDDQTRERIEDSWWKIQIPMWFLYLGALPCIVLALVIFRLKRTKFALVIPTAVYGIAGIVGSSIFIWGTPGLLRDQVEDALYWPGQILSQTGQYTPEQQERLLEIVEKVLSAFWSQMLSPGIYLTFGLFILLLVALVVVSATGKKSGIPSGQNTGIPAEPIFTGQLQCLYGELAGAMISVGSEPLYVGTDPQSCQIVLSSPYIRGVYFSVVYDSYTRNYRIDCFTPGGLYISHPQYGGRQLSPGGGYQLMPGTQIGLDPWQGMFIFT